MKNNRFFLVILITLSLLAANIHLVSAQALGYASPTTSSLPPQPAASLHSSPDQAQESGSTLLLPALKAVLIVGPIDEDTGDWTKREIDNMELAATAFANHGVEVVKFYTPNNNWDEITAAARDAQFLIYRGHGVNWVGSPEAVGGFYLKGRFVTPDDLKNDLHLLPNAIIMIYACYSAGTSGSDVIPGISQDEAYRRVGQYSEPFIANGAAGYYADWYGSAFPTFIDDLFAGKTMEEAYKNFDFDPTTFVALTHPADASQALWLDSHYFREQTQWNHAFVGQPVKTLEMLYGAEMVVNPGNVEYTAADQNVKTFSVGVSSTLATAAFDWTASVSSQDGWVALSKTAGASGDSLTLTLNPKGLSAGTYNASVHFTTNTSQIGHADQVITVSMTVNSSTTSTPEKHYLFMPVLAK